MCFYVEDESWLPVVAEGSFLQKKLIDKLVFIFRFEVGTALRRAEMTSAIVDTMGSVSLPVQGQHVSGVRESPADYARRWVSNAARALEVPDLSEAQLMEAQMRFCEIESILMDSEYLMTTQLYQKVAQLSRELCDFVREAVNKTRRLEDLMVEFQEAIEIKRSGVHLNGHESSVEEIQARLPEFRRQQERDRNAAALKGEYRRGGRFVRQEGTNIFPFKSGSRGSDWR